MKLKKIVSLAMSVVLSISLLIGCSGKNKDDSDNASNEKAILKIGMITDVAGVNDQSSLILLVLYLLIFCQVLHLQYSIL